MWSFFCTSHAQLLLTYVGFLPMQELLNRMDYVNEALLESPTPEKPRPIAETPLTVVSTLSDLNEMVAKLTAAGEIAVRYIDPHLLVVNSV